MTLYKKSVIFLLNGKILSHTIMQIKDLETLSALVKKTRKEQNLTQSDLAAACGVGVRYIVDLERAKESCQIGKALKIVRMLGIELEAK